jgi:hypothetical protein
MDNKPTPQPTEQVTETTEQAADDVATQSTETAEPNKIGTLWKLVETKMGT